MPFQKVACVLNFEKSSAICVNVVNEKQQNLEIAIVRDSKGEFHAIDDLCTHGQVSLSEGEVDDDCIECWAHGAKFNLQTGAGTLPAMEAVKVYNLKIDGNDILVDVDSIKNSNEE